MAFLHCHSCDWEQDDYWSFHFSRRSCYIKILGIGWDYNPVSCFLSHILGRNGYWWPRRIKFDVSTAKEHGWRREDPHSWFLAWHEFKRMIRKFRSMRWWTHEAFERDTGAVCPSCGARNFDVD